MKEYPVTSADPLEAAFNYLYGLAHKACKEGRPHDVRYLVTQAENISRIGRRIDDMKLHND